MKLKYLQVHFAISRGKIILINWCCNLVHRREYFGKRESSPHRAKHLARMKQRESRLIASRLKHTPKERKARQGETNQIRQTLSSAYPVGGYRQLCRSRFAEQLHSCPFVADLPTPCNTRTGQKSCQSDPLTGISLTCKFRAKIPRVSMSVQVVSRRGVSGRTRQVESEGGKEGGGGGMGGWRKRESERRDVLITSIDVHLQWIDVWSVLHHAQGSTGPKHTTVQATLREGWTRIQTGASRDGQIHLLSRL